VEESVLQGDPLWVEVDALRLKQVCVNLAKNALKFVPAGFVRMGAKRVEGWPEGWVEVYIEDSGPGIPASKAESMFDKFTQMHSHDKGTGIGLALCREIAEAMGGSVKVDTTYASQSEFGPGTRFVVGLPLPEVAEPAVQPEGAAAQEGRLAKKAGEVSNSSTLAVGKSGDSCRRGAYRVLVVAENQVAGAEIARVLKKANGDKWWVGQVSYENQPLGAAVDAAAPVDLVVLHHPKSVAVVEETVTVVQKTLGESAVKTDAGEKQVFTKKPFVVVMEDNQAAEDADDDINWNAVGADVVCALSASVAPDLACACGGRHFNGAANARAHPQVRPWSRLRDRGSGERQ
jgi:hypothetical protein